MRENELVGEYLSVWHFTHQQLNHDGYLLALQSETFGAVWRFSDGLVQSVQGIGVLSADCLHPASVEQILAELVAGLAFGEGSLLDEVVCGIDVAVAEIVSEQQIQQSRLADLVVAHTCSIIRVQ